MISCTNVMKVYWYYIKSEISFLEYPGGLPLQLESRNKEGRISHVLTQ